MATLALAGVGTSRGGLHYQRAIWVGLAAGGVLAAGAGLLSGAAVLQIDEHRRQLALAVGGLATVTLLTWVILRGEGDAQDVAIAVRRRVGQATAHGSFFVGAIVFLMVLREGSEWALMTLPILGSAGFADWLVGSGIGLAAALLCGRLIYRGRRRFSAVTAVRLAGRLLTVVAAGLLARSLAGLQQIGLIPSLFAPIWDATGTPWVGHGPLAELLKGFVGWNPQPSVEEVVAWVLYAGAVGTASFMAGRRASTEIVTAATNQKGLHRRDTRASTTSQKHPRPAR